MSVRSRNALVGLGGLGLVAVVGYLLFLFLSGFFKPGFEVTATFERAGQLLRAGSDVKARGVLVGEVTRVTVTERGNARVVMRIFPGASEQLPDNVRAAIRAKTLFGEKLVSLEIPADRSARNLSPGDEIPLERTTGPFEVETILRKAVPVLAAVDPDQLAAALHALAQGFSGNEQALRNAAVQGDQALSETARTLPELERDLVHLRDFARSLDEVDRDLLEALAGLEVAGRSIERRSAELETVLASLPRLAGDLADILVTSRQDLSDLAVEGRRVLEVLQEKAPDLPELVRLLDGFLGVWIGDLSFGPYWRILVTEAPTFEAHPYPPGEGPEPRTAQAEREALIAEISGSLPERSRPLTDLLLAPLPTEEIQPLLRRLRPPPVGEVAP